MRRSFAMIVGEACNRATAFVRELIPGGRPWQRMSKPAGSIPNQAGVCASPESRAITKRNSVACPGVPCVACLALTRAVSVAAASSVECTDRRRSVPLHR
jgi:hypothetical protein